MEESKFISLDPEVEITYIKGGKEYTRKVTQSAFWESKRIYLIEYFYAISIPEEIEFLSIKNLHCPKSTEFICPNTKTVLILDHCIFKGETRFNAKNVSILYPNFIDTIEYSWKTRYVKRTTLCFWETDNLEMVLEKHDSEEKEKIKCTMINNKNISIRGNASDIELETLMLDDRLINYPTSLKVIDAENLIIPGFPNMTFQEISIIGSRKIELKEGQILKKIKVIDSDVTVSNTYLSSIYNGAARTGIFQQSEIASILSCLHNREAIIEKIRKETLAMGENDNIKQEEKDKQYRKKGIL